MSQQSCRDCARPLTVIPDGFGEAYSCPRCDKPAAPTRCTCAGIADEYAPCPVHEPAAQCACEHPEDVGKHGVTMCEIDDYEPNAPVYYDEYDTGGRKMVCQPSALYNQPTAPTRTAAELPTFEQVWAEKEAEGYQYGRDALEQVRFGFELALRGLK